MCGQEEEEEEMIRRILKKDDVIFLSIRFHHHHHHHMNRSTNFIISIITIVLLLVNVTTSASQGAECKSKVNSYHSIGSSHHALSCRFDGFFKKLVSIRKTSCPHVCRPKSGIVYITCTKGLCTLMCRFDGFFVSTCLWPNRGVYLM
ncbi:hypothetical protein DFA_09691 [Cavenderia fasciculata]|uniref:Uncharacterized protein n=1 Tax=Cavenderia fasciculata TaxID=261658 RepID=F4Q8B9_CACFS|nr:uncharacterized protein DFA_09691 [Cavenderia fasciculata]EGG16019.1 hypothetical protein DFA_09691 [Cavenderia fasciculata]|eukprot:XP_004352344.1 hypothetical protein DFA_09691 [Cavenderia fasciculata]